MADMNYILVLNAGSSSLKFKLFCMKTDKAEISGNVDGIGLPTCKLVVEKDSKKSIVNKKVKNHTEAVKLALESLGESKKYVRAVGHRVVHGGESYSDATIVTDKVIKCIDKLSELAPLHNPHNLAGIKACKKLLPKVRQVAVFDTAFHQTLPKTAYLYGIDYKYYKADKVRRYGFHGTSHKYVANKAAEIRGVSLSRLKMITCHLGNGSSITAIDRGKSIDTSMGFTPLEGLVMGTRSGDIDPEVVLYLMKRHKMTASEVIFHLNKDSGLKGISGISSDVRTLHKSKHKMAKLALDIFCYRIKKYIGAYLMALGGTLNVLVFTGGIGENAYYVRKNVCNGKFFDIDLKLNKKNSSIISSHGSQSVVMVVPTNEELMIVKETKKKIKKRR